MVARFSQCCTRTELQSVLAGRAGASLDSQLESHLQECSACREELERLAAAPEWWQRARSYLGVEDGLESSIDHSAATRAPNVAGFQPRQTGPEGVAVREQILAQLPPGLLEAADDPAKIGRIGGYDVVELIGRGGMGVVLKAFDAALNRFVALKVLAAELAHNASARRRFAREAQAAAAVVHDHVVPIYAVDGAGPIPYLVMAYIPGRSLQERIDETGPLEVREILRIGMQTAAGLAAAHAQGLVHRDIKPANILLENSVERVRITDFGLARAMDEASQTQSGVLAGTPQYMAPEQAAGEAIDYRTDLFSLGSVLYAMCTGHSPFRAETTVAVLRRICDGSPRPLREINPDVPVWLSSIIGRLLSKRPGDRFASAEDVARLLAEHLAQLQNPPPPRLLPRRRTVAWIASSAVAIAAIVLFTIFAGESGQSKQQWAEQATSTTQPAAGARVSPAGQRINEAAASQPAPIIAPAPREGDSFLIELGAVKQELDRLEAVTHFGGGHASRFDPLRHIEANLDALEREIGVPESILPSDTSSTKK